MGRGPLRSLSLLLVTAAILFDGGQVSACSPIPGHSFPRYTMSQTLAQAPVVVIGTDVHHARTSPDYWSNYTVEVHCVLKAPPGGESVGRQIFLVAVGANSCSSSRMSEGKTYLLALGPSPEADELPGDHPQHYGVYEPAVMNTGVFEATPDNLAATATLCGLDDEFRSPEDTVSRDQLAQCPARLASSEDCVTPSAGSAVWRVGVELWIWGLLSLILHRL